VAVGARTRARGYRFEREEAERLRHLRVEVDEHLPLPESEVLRRWEAVALLTDVESPRNHHEVLGHDLTQRSGWDALTADQRQRLLDIRVRYQQPHDP
jgi:hypothetical protein